ncbi:MAG: hypothetical protein NVS1B11_31870 [Terriglobales bacterium]
MEYESGPYMRRLRTDMSTPIRGRIITRGLMRMRLRMSIPAMATPDTLIAIDVLITGETGTVGITTGTKDIAVVGNMVTAGDAKTSLITS